MPEEQLERRCRRGRYPRILVYFERMDNTQTASMDIAVGKAKAAATYRRPTRVSWM